MDCFYAQVEMIRNPHLKTKPLGVQQKNIVVTCNYEARSLGVHKLMLVREAKDKCPQLVLVSGEDLTHYREMSYKATELLEEFSTRVERLGFDENFIDVTELVDKKLHKLQQNDSNLEVSVSGHVYNNQPVNLEDVTHLRLAAGSHIAADMRAALFARLSLTGCAGVASNKLFSKLVSGTFKPNQQTVLLPESSIHLMNSLGHVMKVPGIGYRTAQRLESLNLSNICDLQNCHLSILEKAFGRSAALKMQMLSKGEDESPVTPSGPPQSLSDEDSFKKCSTVLEVKEKMNELLNNLLNRLSKDGRSPHTLRLTIRQFHPINKWFNRESRQCTIPNHVIQNMGTENKDVTSPLMELLMKLFEKMIDVKMPFHLTLINVCFANLKASNTSRNAIGFYLTQKAQPKDSQSRKETDVAMDGLKSNSGVEQITHTVCHLTKEKPFSPSLPEDIDMDVFSQLPEEIRNEILLSPSTSGAHKGIQTCQSPKTSKGILHFFNKAKGGNPSTCNGMDVDKSDHSKSSYISSEAFKCSDYSTGESLGDIIPLSNAGTCTTSSYLQNKETNTDAGANVDNNESDVKQSAILVPKSFDQNVFSELPADLQKELLSEWKQQNHTSKIPVKKQHEKAKAKKTQTSKQPNSLLKYFKPNH
ncbi:DNA polymerase iota [Pelobates cultripes]|nr:DNA polymerase iota [Pelobates cultripes]